MSQPAHNSLQRFFQHVCRFSAVCALLFFSLILATVLIKLPLNLSAKHVVIPLVGGFSGGLIFFVFVSRLPFLYVFGHELTHWLVATCFLRKTGSMKIAGAGGHVQVERPNIWIILSPYFVPLYALIWAGFYGAGQMVFGSPHPGVAIGFNVGLGITYAYHVKMTTYALLRTQSDLRVHGVCLSLSLIVFCNTALVLFCLIVASGQWGRGWQLTNRYFVFYGETIVTGGAVLFRWAQSLVR